LPQTSKRQFSDYEGMRQHATDFEQAGEGLVANGK
jgi:hypothetical protein